MSKNQPFQWNERLKLQNLQRVMFFFQNFYFHYVRFELRLNLQSVIACLRKTSFLKTNWLNG